MYGIRSELVRKSIHFLIAFSPLMAVVNKPLTLLFLTAGILSYVFMENLRLLGVKVPVVSTLTTLSSRPQDTSGFVMGPVTLGFGALLALILFPLPAATIAIYALAFGDGFASLIGKIFGKTRPFFLFGKSIEGCLACFIAVFISAFAVSRSLHISLIAASAATITEAIPLGNYDNLALPIIVGFIVMLMI